MLSRLTFTVFVVFSLLRSEAQLPDGFFLEEVSSDIEFPMGVVFADSSHWFRWNSGGQVYLSIDGITQPTPVIDLSEEVGTWSDHGLLSVALSPDFIVSGDIFLYYVVDRHHLMHFGETTYHPDSNDYFNATIARLTRYTLDVNDYSQVVPGTRQVLIGSNEANGIPIMGISHAGGTMNFGSDGTLLLTTGDGTWSTYVGEGPIPEGNYDDVALADGIIRPDENIGSLRSQYVNSLNGKVLRIDPQTGAGIPSNPYYSSDMPNASRSKVWAFGFRNPFRATIDITTGSTDPAAGNPGTLYIGDVGYYSWEELNICNGPGMNFGWPLYEGMGKWWEYDILPTFNLDEPNPLANGSSCPSYFTFHDLITDPNQSHVYSYTNPCDLQVQLADSVVKNPHARPALTWNNNIISPQEFSTLLPGYDNEGNAESIPVQNTSLNIEPFSGGASIGGDIYLGSSYPESYFNSYFQSDYAGWIKVFTLNDAEEVIAVDHFHDIFNVVQSKYNPFDENMYFTTIFPDKLYKLTYGANRAPVIGLDADVQFGPSPLTVSFDASATFDPDQDDLTFDWNFGDGTFNADPEMTTHTFIGMDNEPESFTVTLIVTDAEGNSAASDLLISINNTPPTVEITGDLVSGVYDGFHEESFGTTATVLDFESSDEDLLYDWSLFLHHNSHFHLEDSYSSHEGQITFGGIGCNTLETYYFRVSLTVEDPWGLVGHDEIYLYPDCDSTNVTPGYNPDWSVYPNPTSGQVTIRGPLMEDETFTLTLFDTMGRMLYNEAQQVDSFGRLGFNFESLMSGHYLLQIKGEGKEETLPLLISPSGW